MLKLIRAYSMARALRTKTCVAYARLARFEGAQTNLNLETLVGQIISTFSDAKSRKTSELFDDQCTQLTNYQKYSGGGIAVSIDCHSPENETSTIKNNPRDEEKVVKQPLRAPKGHSMIKYEVFAYIQGNNLLLVGDIVKEYVFDQLINHLAWKANVIQSDLKVVTSAVTVQDKIRQVNKYGVAKIELNISAYAHALEQATAAGKSLMSKPFGVIHDILSQHNATSVIASSNVSYYLTVDITKLTKAQLHKAEDGSTTDPIEQWSKKAAEGVLEDYMDDYTIVLRGKGGKIRQSELKVKRELKVRPHGKSFDTQDMWHNLSAAYKELHKEGHF